MALATRKITSTQRYVMKSDDLRATYEQAKSDIARLNALVTETEKLAIAQGLMTKTLTGVSQIAAHERKTYARIWND